jgi:hypothetical protein
MVNSDPKLPRQLPLPESPHPEVNGPASRRPGYRRLQSRRGSPANPNPREIQPWLPFDGPDDTP